MTGLVIGVDVGTMAGSVTRGPFPSPPPPPQPATPRTTRRRSPPAAEIRSAPMRWPPSPSARDLTVQLLHYSVREHTRAFEGTRIDCGERIARRVELPQLVRGEKDDLGARV